MWNHTYADHIQYKTDFDLSIQFSNGIRNFRSLYIFPAVVFLLAVDFDFIQLNSFPFMTNILLYVMKKIYTWLSLLERFPPPLSLISYFLQGSVLKQNMSLMQKIRNSCFSCFSTRFQAVLDSNRPIYVSIGNQSKIVDFWKGKKQNKQLFIIPYYHVVEKQNKNKSYKQISFENINFVLEDIDIQPITNYNYKKGKRRFS